METMLVPSSADQSFSPYKQIMKNPNRNMHHFTPKTYESFPPTSNTNIIRNGILFAPPYPSHSFSLPPYPISYLNPKQQKQPPLLPLPNTKPYNLKTQGNKKLNKSPKKSKTNSTSPKKEAVVQRSRSDVSETVVIESTVRLGPDPNDLPKEFSGVLLDLEKFSGCMYAISPPPSSLPLPKFSIRPAKLTCKAEAAGVDVGATDNLRRLLRLP